VLRVPPARTWIGGQNQEELGRQPYDSRTAGDNDMSGLQRLPQGVEHTTAELRGLIQEENPAVGE
jgi:hypothetical protein